mgnify:FL=1
MVSKYWQDTYCVQKVAKTPVVGSSSVEAFADGNWSSFPLVGFPEAFWEWNRARRGEYISIFREILSKGSMDSRKLDLAGPHNAMVATCGSPRDDSRFALNNAVKGMGFLPKAERLDDIIHTLQSNMDASTARRLDILQEFYDNAEEIYAADRLGSLELYSEPLHESQTFINQMQNPACAVVWLDVPTFKIKSIVRLLDPQDPNLTDYERSVTQYINLIHSFFHGKFPKDFITSLYFNVEIYDSSPGQSGGKGMRII